MAAPFFDLKSSLTHDYFREFVENKDVVYTIEVDGKPFEIAAKWLLFNLIFWRPLIVRDVPILSRYLFYNELFTDDVRQRIHWTIYDDLDRDGRFDMRAVQAELCHSVNIFYNVIDLEMNAYHRGISIFEIAETLEIPEVAEVINIDVSKELVLGIKAVESKYAKAYKEILSVMEDDFGGRNCFSPFLKLGCFNRAQFPQVIGAGGTRTDVDDTMINLPIQSSYTNGFSNILEYAADSLAAKKSVFYNAREMPMTQYSNRKQQLLASVIRYKYKGDCGTSLTVNFRINKAFARQVLGKNIVDRGRLVCLSAENINDYVDTTVQMRSVMTCNYTNGYCETCGGRLSKLLPDMVIPGIASAIEVMAPVAQTVLSNKHVAKTVASQYELPPEMMRYLTTLHNEIYFHSDVDLKNVAIGVPYSAVERLTDLEDVQGAIKNDFYFTNITDMTIGDLHTLTPVTYEVGMGDRNKAIPYFSSDFLRMIKENPECVVVSPTNAKMVWIDASRFDKRKPFMRAVVVNDSTRQFVKRIEQMFSQKIKGYTRLEDVLRDFSNTIWERASPNLMHLETVLRASMVTSSTNYDIPVVTDPDNVMFATLSRIIPRRSIGAQLAFQQFDQYVSDAAAYVVPKPTGVFDVLMGYSD